MEQRKKLIVYAILSAIFTLFMLVGLDIALEIGILESFGLSPKSVFGDQHKIIGYIIFGIFLLADFRLMIWLTSKKHN